VANCRAVCVAINYFTRLANVISKKEVGPSFFTHDANPIYLINPERLTAQWFALVAMGLARLYSYHCATSGTWVKLVETNRVGLRVVEPLPAPKHWGSGALGVLQGSAGDEVKRCSSTIYPFSRS
jgi:hypothetical protein